MNRVLLILIISFFMNFVHGDFPDYYWRNYKGTVPEDALVAHEIPDGKIFIGQGYSNIGGLFNGPIILGQNELTFVGEGETVHSKSKFIRILCTKHSIKFQWIPNKGNSLFEIPFHLVEGGEENDLGVLFIAKHIENGKVYIGNAGGYTFELPKMKYVEDKKAMITDNYDILAYIQPDDVSSAPPIVYTDEMVLEVIKDVEQKDEITTQIPQ